MLMSKLISVKFPEIKELLIQIDEEKLDDIPEPRKRLVLFLQEVYSNNKKGDRDLHA